MICIRKANKTELDKILSFYKECGYSGGANENDYILVATEDNNIIAVVRLCLENEILILRGMQILSKYQKQGIGTKILNELNKVIADQDCYCLPKNLFRSVLATSSRKKFT